MVILLDLGAIVSDQHLITADDRAYGGAGRQFQFTHRATDHLGGIFIAVGNGFDGLGRATAQAVDVGDIGPAHVGQQRRDGGLLGRDGDVDGAALHQVHVGTALYEYHRLLGPIFLASRADMMLASSSLVTAMKTSI